MASAINLVTQHSILCSYCSFDKDGHARIDIVGRKSWNCIYHMTRTRELMRFKNQPLATLTRNPS